MNTDTQQFLVAFYGALLSTGVFIWNIVRTFRDQARLMITGMLEVTLPSYSPPILNLTITNVGTRPVIYMSYGAHSGPKSKFMAKLATYILKSDPKYRVWNKSNRTEDQKYLRLEPYGFAIERVDINLFTGIYKHFFVVDTSGKRHYMSNRLYKRFKTKIEDELDKIVKRKETKDDL